MDRVQSRNPCTVSSTVLRGPSLALLQTPAQRCTGTVHNWCYNSSWQGGSQTMAPNHTGWGPNWSNHKRYQQVGHYTTDDS